MVVCNVDLHSSVTGRVCVELTSGSSKIPVIDRPNIIAYEAAGIMARMAAGMEGRNPRYIAAVYGANDNPGLLPPNTTRDHSWSKVSQELADANANALIMPISLSPSVDGDAVTFSANTGHVEGRAFSGQAYADEPQNLDPVYFYQVILIDKDYRIFARSTLMSGGVYKAKPQDYDLSIQWEVKFK